jgi:hypothetical protein
MNTILNLTIARSALEKLLIHAASAARLVSHLGAPAGEPIVDHIDAIVHELTEQITLDWGTLEKLLAHATSAARIVGHNDALAIGPLADHVDAIVHELSELLGNPHLVAAPVPSARSTFALDVTPDAVPEHVAPDAPAASRTISIAIDDGTRHELVRLSDPDELGISFADDETTQPHIALSGDAR